MNLKYKCEKQDTINNILKNHFHFSNNYIKKLKNNNCIFLNDTKAYVSQTANINDTLMINLDYIENENNNIVPTKMDLIIVYEDEYMLIIDKPAGIAVHPSINHYSNSLSNGVISYYKEQNLNCTIHLVNRLDKDTSGLIIFAKYSFIQEALSKQMKNGDFKKYYLGIICGTLSPLDGEINLPIVRKENSIIERKVDEKNTEKKSISITEYKTIKSNNEFSLVEFHLITGRTHQIRVHTSYLMHPLLGDTLYGTASKLISHQALHSSKISFIHPITNKELTFISEPDFINIIK